MKQACPLLTTKSERVHITKSYGQPLEQSIRDIYCIVLALASTM